MCCQRRHQLESEIDALKFMMKQQQKQLESDRFHLLPHPITRHMGGSKPMQQQQQQPLFANHSPSSVVAFECSSRARGSSSISESSSMSSPGTSCNTAVDGREYVLLEQRLQSATEERERLAHTLREENWMKEQLLTAYHTSVRQITDLPGRSLPAWVLCLCDQRSLFLPNPIGQVSNLPFFQ